MPLLRIFHLKQMGHKNKKAQSFDGLSQKFSPIENDSAILTEPKKTKIIFSEL